MRRPRLTLTLVFALAGTCTVLFLLPEARDEVQSVTAPSNRSVQPSADTALSFQKVSHATSAPPDRRASRAREEWQGMPVERGGRIFCNDASTCGLARACVDKRCDGCTDDLYCAPGERCVLEHCLRAELVECASRRDCPGDELCALSGYSSDPRGNASMHAHCLPLSGGQDQAAALPAGPTQPAQSDEQRLLTELTESRHAAVP